MLPVIALVVASAALVTSAILAMTLTGMRDNLRVFGDQQIRNDISNNYWTTRLEFCYERNLNPCTGDVIDAWNKAYPDDTYNSVPPSSD